MDKSKVAPLGVLIGGAVAFGIIIYAQSNFTAPNQAWLVKPFLWILIPIAFIAITAGVALAALIAAKPAIMDTSTLVGTAAGIYACMIFIFKGEIGSRSIILSLLIGFILYGFYSFVLGGIVGEIKNRNE